MIEHSDELAARVERQADEVAVARLEGQDQGWREAAGPAAYASQLSGAGHKTAPSA